MANSNLTPTYNEIVANYLSTIKNGYFDIGITNVNVSKGSDHWVNANAIATQLCVLFNQLLVAGDELMPDTTNDDGLDRWLSFVRLTRRPAGGSIGSVTFVTDFQTLVPTGAELTSADGQRYAVTQGGSYANGAIIPIASVDTGAATEKEITEVLTWSSAPFGAQSTVNLYTALTGGVDAETDDLARARLLDRLAHVPAAANWQYIVELAESLDPVVMKGFVFPIANGPSTVHVALAGYPVIGTKSRAIDTTKINSLLRPRILGNMPEYVETVVTTVEDVPIDVAFELTVPLSTNASSPLSGQGTNTGWVDATPFPVADSVNRFFIPVTAVSSSTTFTIDTISIDPVAGITHINWIDRNDPTEWTVKQATITSFTGTGPHTVTIDVPFVGIAVNDWVFPASVNAQKYVDAILKGFSFMGPGEKINPGALPGSARRPRQTESFPSSCDSSLLRYLINAGEEVLTADYYYRSIQTPGVDTDSAANVTVTPTTPTLIADAPKILIPRQIGFYPPYPLV